MIDFDGGVDAGPDWTIDVVEDGDVVRWAVTNTANAARPLDRVQLRWRVTPTGPLRMFVNGYQSWSPAAEHLVPGPPDPSRADGVPALIRAMHHADPAIAADGELRSELVSALTDDSGTVVIGFEGGDRHDGTLRLTGDTLVAEAYMGGAVIAPGERRDLHAVRVTVGGDLAAWALWAGRSANARTGAPYQVGWCSWYHYFDAITEAALRDNLARAADWPFDVFQLDDGYQAAIGDWLDRAEAFPTPLDRLAADIGDAGYTPGLWLAPFLAAPHSSIAAAHPDWFLRRPSGRPAVGSFNPAWGGAVWALDTTRPDVLTHLEHLAAELVAMGWRYLKLDFTYAPALDGEWHNPTLTPAQRVRLAYDAVRRGAGDDAFLLGCGAPLGPCIGVVDGMRIGPDVAPHWEPRATFPGYDGTAPSTSNALRNTIARDFMHRRLWLNDPDCLMLRATETELSIEQIRAWADAVGASGGMALVSDDLALLDTDARRLLDDVVAVGREADSRRVL
ncbi:MAG TPA: glycoside hydrolase family 36 protein [Acidimicrobiales bacterium]|nr:glycoside hydrolase family 36 protein [Acidimicrobiales bacterium]